MSERGREIERGARGRGGRESVCVCVRERVSERVGEKDSMRVMRGREGEGRGRENV